MAKSLKNETTDSCSEICIFCSKHEDEKLYGQLYTKDGVTAHYFCLLFSSGLAQQGEDSEGLVGFLPPDILKEHKRSRLLRCCQCKKKGASIGCAETSCRKSYHYGCAKQNGTTFLYHDDFRSYCKAHCTAISQTDLTPEERVSLKTKENDTCYICYETLETRISPTTVLAPCCIRAWYHRGCLEEMAYSAGIHYFKCPLCNNIDEWQAEMLSVGIYIPDRDASWELVPGAYNSLLEQRLECIADVCVCPQGRLEDDSDGEWELIMCETCGSQAVHTQCGKLRKADKEWLCTMCSIQPTQVKENEEPEPSTKEERGSRKRPIKATPNKYQSRANRSQGIQEVTNLMQNNL